MDTSIRLRTLVAPVTIVLMMAVAGCTSDGRVSTAARSNEPVIAPPLAAVPTDLAATATTSPRPLFFPGPEVLEGAATFQVGLGDLDGDGDLDAVFANMESYSQVWLNDGHGNLSATAQRLTDQGHGVGIEDLDGDGDLDLFITCASRGGSDRRSTVYLNDGSARFAVGQSLADLESSGNSIDLIDVDGDGDVDACIQYYQLPHRVYRNDGHGNFSQSEVEFPSDVELAWGDLDADGDVDVFTKEFGKGYRTMLNDGDGHFQDRWQMPLDAVEYGYRSVALGDLDGDGDLDALVTNGSLETAYPFQILLNDGTGRLDANGQTLPGLTKSWVELGDLDGDRDLDALIVIIRRASQVWINDGRGSFTDSGLRLGADSNARGGALGDLDEDGDIDALVSAFFGGPNRIWLNTTVSP